LYVDIEKKCGSFTLKVKFETDGGVFGVLGASGCGKSMTLKCIAGIEKPDKGIIRLNDRVLFDSSSHINLPVRRRHVGYLFQDYALFPNMTVMQNVMCGARDKKKAEEFIKRFYLEDKKDLYPAQLSGGQKQRVAMARMLSSSPELILLDEPFSALDNYLKTNLERQVMDMLEIFDKPVLFVSHDRNEIYRMTDRIAVMDDGCIVDIQNKQEMFDNPRTLAATFLTGCKNVTRLQYMDETHSYAKDWGITLEYPEQKQIIKEEMPDGKSKSGYKYAAFRAHYFELVDAPEECNVLECETVRVIEDTFSTVVMFRNKNCDAKGDYSILTYELPKEEWRRIKDGRIFLKVVPERVMLLNR
jgi:molybdate transport system ATP-binding protein